MAKRWIPKLPPALELACEELLDGVPRCERHGPRVGRERLDDHAAGRIASAPAGQLREELERPLLGTKIGQRKPHVRIHDRGELDTLEVVSLGDHLRAEEDRPVGGIETRECGRELRWIAGRVRVQANQLELGETLGELSLQALRAGPESGELDGAARRAEIRSILPEAAVMAVETAVGVQRERDVALAAANGHAARAAMERG